MLSYAAVKKRGNVLSESSVFGAKELGCDALIVGHWGFSIEIWRQDVCIKFFKVAVQLFTMNKDLWSIKGSIKQSLNEFSKPTE